MAKSPKAPTRNPAPPNTAPGPAPAPTAAEVASSGIPEDGPVYVGNSNTGMERRRDGVVFFTSPHLYAGEPTPGMHADKYLRVNAYPTTVALLAAHPGGPPPGVDAEIQDRIRLQASEYWGLPEADLRSDLKALDVDHDGMDYQALVKALEDRKK